MGDMLTGCLLAAAVVVPAAFAGFAALIWIKSHNFALPATVLGAGGIRMLLALIGSAIIMGRGGVPVVWFVAWMATFYMIVMIAEVCYAIRMINKKDKGLKIVGDRYIS